ncbi:MAG: recombinase family protein [Elusimicrobia bacterium]|nr:recombinase family protein [Elusimicrobiota bacterium]
MKTSNTLTLDAPEIQKPAKPVRCAVYTRVSTDQQAEVKFNSCEAQEERIKSFIASQENFVLSKVYSDPGFTGANTDRPGLQKMLQDIRSDSVDMVVTYKIDRLTRSPRDFYQLIELFEAHHAGFISVTERFDTSTPAGRLLRNIMLTFAQFERELTSERIRDKVLQRAQRGLYTGGHAPFGYVIQEGRITIEKKRADIIRAIYDLYVESRSVQQIVKMLADKAILSRNGKPLNDTFVYHVLKCRVYTGHIVHKKKVYPGKHEPIISAELFNHVQTLIETEPRKKGATPGRVLPFAGLIRCSECGSTMSASFIDKMNKSGPRRYFYYRCSSLSHKGWKACSTREINADRFSDMFYRDMLRVSMDPEYLKNLIFSRNYQTRPRTGVGFEPFHENGDLTPEKLQENLKAFVKAYARKTGIEKTLEVRRWIKKVEYSQKTISVEFVYAGADLRRPALSSGGEAVEVEGRRPLPLTSFSDGEKSPSSDHEETSPGSGWGRTPPSFVEWRRPSSRHFPVLRVRGGRLRHPQKEPVPHIGTDSSSWLDTDRNLAG